MVKWEDLKDRQKCIYQALTKAETDSGKVMADYVNSKGTDADDGEALVLLARKYKYKCEGAFSSEFFWNPVHYNPERNAHLVIAITGNSDITRGSGGNATLGAALKGLFQTPAATPMDDPTKPLTDKRFDDVEWHAVYGSTKAGTQIAWQDDQRIRPSGPAKAGDFCVVFSRAKG